MQLQVAVVMAVTELHLLLQAHQLLMQAVEAEVLLLLLMEQVVLAEVVMEVQTQ
jgi:hypothetical protein